MNNQHAPRIKVKIIRASKRITRQKEAIRKALDFLDQNLFEILEAKKMVKIMIDMEGTTISVAGESTTYDEAHIAYLKEVQSGLRLLEKALKP